MFGRRLSVANVGFGKPINGVTPIYATIKRGRKNLKRLWVGTMARHDDGRWFACYHGGRGRKRESQMQRGKLIAMAVFRADLVSMSPRRVKRLVSMSDPVSSFRKR